MFQELWLKIEESILVMLRAFQELSRVKRYILAVGVIILIPSYFVAKYASYYIWNYQYRGDIVSARPSFNEAKDLVIGPTSVINLGGEIYSAFAEVENQNLDLSFQKADYEFSFYNSQKAKVSSARGSLFMLPNTKKYVIASRVSSREPVASADLTIGNIFWQKKAVIPSITLRTPEPSIYNSLNPLELVAEGVVINNSPYRLSNVRLTFVLLNSSGKIIGGSERSEFTVLPNERRAYVQRWPNIYLEEVASIEVFAETNALDGNNLILQDLPNSGGSDLSRPEINPFF